MEEKIIALLKTDPQEAMALLVEEYTGLLWSVAGQHLTNPEDIRECVNDTFAEFYFHQDRFDRTKGSLPTFLAAIARNRAVSRYRKNRTREAAPLPEDVADTTADMDLSEARLDVERAMEQLKPEDVEIIRMKYYEGKSVREIAESLGLPYETVKKRHQRGLSKLRMLLLGLVIAAILALLAACAYAVLRHFGIIPSYGISSDPQAQAYILDEETQVKDAEGRYVLDDAMWLENELYIQVDFYPNDPSYMLRSGGPTSSDSTKAQVTEIMLNGELLCIAMSGSMRMGMHESEHGTHWRLSFSGYPLEIPSALADELELSFVLNGMDVSFRMKRVRMDELSAYSYQVGGRGGLLAIPRLEEGRLIVSIYPLNTGEATLLPSILRGEFMEGEAGEITAVSSSGTELAGKVILTPKTGSRVYYYDWDFGPADPGEYTIHVPYVYVTVSPEEPVDLHMDLEKGTWDKQEFPVPGGTLSIADCTPLASGSGGMDDRVRGEVGDYWSLTLRYHPEEDLVLTSCQVGLSPEMEVQDKVVEERLEDGAYVMAAAERGFGVVGYNCPEDNLTKLELKGWEGYFDPSNVILRLSGPLSLRWTHSFDLPVLVEPEG